MDIALAIEALVPAADYRGSTTANTKAAYDALVWEDVRPKPTWAQVQAVEILPPIPSSCGPDQAKIVLWEAGLLDAVEAMVAAHPYRPVSLWYESATVWERSHPYVTALAYELGLTDKQMDDLFTQTVMK